MPLHLLVVTLVVAVRLTCPDCDLPVVGPMMIAMSRSWTANAGWHCWNSLVLPGDLSLCCLLVDVLRLLIGIG